MTSADSHPGRKRLGPTEWLILVLASIGFACDIYVIIMAQFVIGPAMQELGGFNPATEEGRNSITLWRSLLVYVPALAGGIFGLLGGYLTDFLGRRRVLTWSILLYAFSSFAAGYSTSLTMLLVFRSTTFIGVCVEFVAAVAWLAELFDDPHQRESVLGYTQAFSSFGGLLVAIAFGIASDPRFHFPRLQFPDFLGASDKIKNGVHAWRYTLISGVLPAIPLILIRPFLPESPKWKQKKEAGTLKRPSIIALFAPAFRRTTIVSTLMFACAYGAAFGAIQHIPEMVKGLASVKEEKAEQEDQQSRTLSREALNRMRVQDIPNEVLAKLGPLTGKEFETTGALAGAIAGALSEDERKEYAGKIMGANKAAAAARSRTVEQTAASEFGKLQEVGGLVGRFILAALALYIVSRRALIRVFLVPGLIVFPLVFWFFLVVDSKEFFSIPLTSIYLGEVPVSIVSIGVFFAGLFAVAQFSFWGNYLPRVFPMHLRGTGESFAANVGGRAIGVGFWGVTNFLALQVFKPASEADQPLSFTHAAAVTGLFVFACGLLLSFFLPEPGKQDLPD